MIPLPVLISIAVVLTILIGLGSYQFYFKDWNSCDWGYGCPTPSTPSAPTPSTPAPAPCDVNQRVKGGVCVACGDGYINPAGDDPAEYTDTFCKQCAENYHVKNRKCVKCEDKYTHPAGDLVAKGNTKCSTCAKDHRVFGTLGGEWGDCVHCTVQGTGYYRDAGDKRSEPDTECIAPLSKGIPIKIEKCINPNYGSGCPKKWYWQTTDEFRASYPGGWKDDKKCKYNETNHTDETNWKVSCPGGDPDVRHSYEIPQAWKDMKDA